MVRVRAQEVRKLERDELIYLRRGGLLDLVAELAEVDGRKLDVYVAVEGLDVAPARKAVPGRQLPIGLQVARKVGEGHVAVLKRHDVHVVLDASEHLLPGGHMLGQAQGLFSKLLRALNVGRHEDRDVFEGAQVVGQLFVDDHLVLVVGVDFVGDVPPSESVPVAVAVGDLRAEVLVDVHFCLVVALIPERPSVVGAEEEVHVPRPRLRQEEVDEVRVRRQHVAAVAQDLRQV